MNTLVAIETEVQQIVNKSQLAQEQTARLLSIFGGYMEQIKPLVQGTEKLVVTDETQTDLMQQARTIRKQLQDIRVKMDKQRIELKAVAKREVDAIDGMARVIRNLIEPIEEHLQEQEDYKKHADEKRKQEQYQTRIKELTQYTNNTSIYDLYNMTDEAYTIILADQKKLYESRIAEETKAEQERQEQLALDALFMQRKLELAPFTAVVTGTLTRETTQEVYDAMLATAQDAYKKYQQEQQAIREQNEKLQKQNAEIEKQKQLAEEKLRIQQEKIAREKEQALLTEQQEKKRQENEQKKKLLAPDKEKLLQLSKDVGLIELPAVQSNEAQEIINTTKNMIENIQLYLVEQAKKL